MGWATELFCNIHFNRETFNSEYEVKSKIEEEERLIQHYKDTIKNLAIMTEPKKFCGEEDDPMLWINCELRDALEGLEESYINIYKLELLLDNWNQCHTTNGLAINPPEEIKYYTAYLTGDFVKTVKHPD